MKNKSPQPKPANLFGYMLPWVFVYLAIITAAVFFGGVTYHKYNEHRLPTGNIELTVDKLSYQLGETVSFTVTNHFPVPVFVTNQCPNEPLSVYRWNNEEWVQLHAVAQDDSECYTQERNVAIPSEATRSYDFSDWEDLFSSPGVYRIAASIDHYADIPFQDFVILEPAEVVQVEEIVEEYVLIPQAASQAPTPAQAADIVLQKPERIEREDDEKEEHDKEDEEDENHDREDEDDEDEREDDD